MTPANAVARETPAWTRTLPIHACAIALFAATLEQLVHEVCHGVTSMLVGQRWEGLHFFASLSSWPGQRSALGDGLVAGSAATLNILCAVVAMPLLSRGAFARRPLLRLLLFYFAGFSLFSGFGYLLFDPLFYKPAGPNVGDWKEIVGLFGGTWSVRAPIAAIGGAGTLFGFFWLPHAALGFRLDGLTPADKPAFLVRLLVFPYLFVNAVFILMSFWHPLGINGVIIVASKGLFGYSAFLWALSIARSPRMPPFPNPEGVLLPAQMHWRPVVAALAAVALPAIVLLPVLRF